MDTNLRIIAEQNPEEASVRLHFPLELPVLRSIFSCYWATEGIADRTTLPTRWANRQARLNRGRFAQEIPFAADTYAAFLSHLVTVPGLESLLAASRYSLTLQVGRCFDPLEVARMVIQLTFRSFYPELTEREFELTPLPKPAEHAAETESAPQLAAPHFLI